MTNHASSEFTVTLTDIPSDLVWETVSDTQRMNALAGNPRYEAIETQNKDGSVDVFGRLRVAGITIEWQELPVNWIVGQWFEQVRHFKSGPLRELKVFMQMRVEGNQTTCAYRFDSIAKGFIGRLGVQRSLKSYEAKVKEVLHTLRPQAASPPALPPVPTTRSAEARAERIAARIDASPYGHGLAQRLARYVLTAHDIDLWTIRPIALAKEWNTPARHTIELCLQSVREGLLESRWDLLCPRCRVSKAQVAKMDALPTEVHCTSCNIDFHQDFAQNVELAFSPAPGVRQVEYGYFCRSGPGGTPHIKGQLTIAPNTTISHNAQFDDGDYRLRTLEAGVETDIHWSGNTFPSVVLSDDAIAPLPNTTPGQLQITNSSRGTRTIIIEDLSWRADVLVAAHVTTLQAFRDLFSEQTLRPGDDVAVNNVTFMFTDLRGSTLMFQSIGDASAYRVVRDHFTVLGSIIREHSGAIVKTLGDGVHAAFAKPDDALRAAIAIQQAAQTQPVADVPQLGVRIGLHRGSSISVTLNGRLDYYGTTVNLAARLEGESDVGQVTTSGAVIDDPEAEQVLARFEVSTRKIRVRGLSDEVTIHQFAP
ncbi:MAG: adenylate/guanylate cyclase domain-containing protein [Gammaproteobacteria bacterium]|nr:adenylate/guanylate cyclase domain-containing protein [Gammaproteobacteria bacterium]